MSQRTSNEEAALRFAFGGGGGACAAEAGLAGDLPPARVSALALSALVFGIVCCLPGTGLIAAGLGAAAIFAIGRSQGRLAGSGMAIAGIILGLISTMLWVGLIVGAIQFIRATERNITLPTVAFFKAIDAGDFAAARKVLTPAATAKLTDADFQQFRDAVTARLGAFDKVDEIDATQLIQTFRSGQGSGASGLPNLPAGQFPIPLPQTYRFAKNTATPVWILDDPDAAFHLLFGSTALEGQALDCMLLLPDGSVIRLGPAPPAPAAPKAPDRGPPPPSNTPAPPPV